MARGRQAIMRGDVTARSWWNDIDVGDPAGGGRGLLRNINDPDVHEAHWYWFGNDRGITGITRSTYDTPARVLFHELRPDEWDEKPSHARLYNTCGMDDCINPWHFKLSSRGGAPLTGEGKARALREEDLLERLSDTELVDAYRLYVIFIEHWEKMAGALDVRSVTEVRLNYANTRRLAERLGGQGMGEDELENDLVIALVERWLDAELLMTIQEARGAADAISQRRAQARERLKADLADKIAGARKRSGLVVKPRPRRRPDRS
jgi:hypothetical protein